MLSPVSLLLVLSMSAPAEPPPGFVDLFNGKDLAGWKATGDPKIWTAEDGLLVVQGRGGGYLFTEKEYADFELRLEYKMPKMGNSGVGLRCPLKGNPSSSGMEIQLLDDGNWKNLKPWQHTGSIYGIVPAAKVNSRPFGQWNQVRITARGRHILVEQNGEVLVDADLDQHKEKAKERPGFLRKSGHIGLQSYNFRVEFRNLHLKELR